ATASSAGAGAGPQNTVNGSGLNANDQHSTDFAHMWMTDGGLPSWIQYQFDKVYKLDEMWVWNSNQLIESFVGFGAKDVTIEYSVDGQTWTKLGDVHEFARAPGAPTYAANTFVDFGGAMAKYVKLTIETNWGGVTPQAGLSEVRFYYLPTQARGPQPAVGAVGVSIDTDLYWRPGRDAESHEVYLGTDRNALALIGTPTEHTLTPPPLNFGTAYSWKVNEIGASGPYEGDIWSFSTQEYATIDDMESYNDDDKRIYESWVDGLTTGVSGSQVGYDVAPFAERRIVHTGMQAMPFIYNNSVAPFFSEAEREFSSAQNWTSNGADTLSLWVQGAPSAYQESNGVITMSAAGHDIWDNADDFRFAYKTLNGDGSIVVKVESLVNTNAWAKAGVMIRQSLDADSTFVYMIQSFSSGVSMGWRPTTAATCGSGTQAGITAPQWVKLIRKGNVFTAQYSSNGTTWTDLKDAAGTIVSTTVVMNNPVYVGLCVTSHNTAATTTAVMSGAQATGNVTGASWQVTAIGDDPQPANDPADLYVIVQDTAGKTAKATNPTAVTTAGWTQWRVPLSSLTGVNLKSVKKMILGVDSRTSPIKGKGQIYIDDIGYGHPLQ
ncbi:MAG TPA: discoidin domain-containing protein, partial [Sedimentisphaerales bacterium]|nr:discoidin domain-containing protein [Sedimentisphaerales bacterium]